MFFDHSVSSSPAFIRQIRHKISHFSETFSPLPAPVVVRTPEFFTALSRQVTVDVLADEDVPFGVLARIKCQAGIGAGYFRRTALQSDYKLRRVPAALPAQSIDTEPPRLQSGLTCSINASSAVPDAFDQCDSASTPVTTFRLSLAIAIDQPHHPLSAERR